MKIEITEEERELLYGLCDRAVKFDEMKILKNVGFPCYAEVNMDIYRSLREKLKNEN
jgi:hypothetical protein